MFPVTGFFVGAELPIILRHSYTFDNVSGSTLIDEVGSKNLTLINSPSFVTGQVGNAIDLNGSNQSAFSSTSGQRILPLDDFAVSFWLNLDTAPTGITPSNYMCLFGEMLDGESIATNLYRVSANSDLSCTVWTEQNSAGDNIFYKSSANLFTVGSWTHIYIAHYGSNVDIYKNGVFFQTLTWAPPISTAVGFRLGAEGIATPNNFTNGKFDQFKVFNLNGNIPTAADALEQYNEV